MAINSRTKGNKGERNVAALFKKWTGKDFSRTPSSGGLQWKKTNVKGDIVCTKEGHYFPFCIEVKTYRDINFCHLLIPNVKAKIIEFWEQCRKDAVLAKKVPLLIMRFNGMPKDFHFIVLGFNFGMKLKLDKAIDPKCSLVYQGIKYSLVLYQSTDFFKTDYKRLKTLAKTHLKKLYDK